MSKNFRYTDKAEETAKNDESKEVVPDQDEKYDDLDKAEGSGDSSVETSPTYDSGESSSRSFGGFKSTS
jgi:hypothetical protein